MKNVILFGLIGLGLSNLFPQETKSITYEDFAVVSVATEKSVHISDSIMTAKQVLGEPKNERVRDTDLGEYVEYEYDGLIIGYFSDGEGYYIIRIIGSEFTTPRGLTVGATYSEFVEKYGEPSRVYQSNGIYDLALYELANPHVQRGVSDRSVMILNLNFEDGDKISDIFFTFRS